MIEKHPLNSLQDIPAPPETISEAARQEWLALIASVVLVERTRRVDLRSFDSMCEILADCRSLEAAAIHKEGYCVESGGGPKPHPALRSLESARRQAVSLLARFGILPDGSQVYNRPELRLNLGCCYDCYRP